MSISRKAPLRWGQYYALVITLWPFVAPAAEMAIQSEPETHAPGSSVILNVSLQSPDAAVSALQFDLSFDRSAMEVTVTSGPVTRTSGKGLYRSEMTYGVARFMVAGRDAQALSDGVIIQMFVNLKANAAPGAYPLKCAGLLAVGPDGQAIPLSAADGMMVVDGNSSEAIALQPGGILNGASLLPGPIVPGEILTLIGAGIGPSQNVDGAATNSEDTRVLINGLPATVLYAAADQINLAAPPALPISDKARIVVETGQRRIEAETSMGDASPALFTRDASGAGQGVILNQDASANLIDNPAAAGSVVSLFATGLGDTAVGSLAVLINGVDAPVVNAGPMPGFDSGMTFIQCRVPSVDAGAALPVTIHTGSASSPPGVTIAVK